MAKQLALIARLLLTGLGFGARTASPAEVYRRRRKEDVNEHLVPRIPGQVQPVVIDVVGFFA